MTTPLINITLPAHNEQAILEKSVTALLGYLEAEFHHDYEVVIAENGSTDRTWEIADNLARRHERVQALRLSVKGRGGALRAAWSRSKADVLSYMDCDLSSDLEAFPNLVDAVIGEGFDLAIGSRLLRRSTTSRGLKREVISRCYNLLIKIFFASQFSDAQCGFKALTRGAADALLPMVEDDGWFFDTELLLLAEAKGFRIFDAPVRWVDDPDTRVRIVRTAWDDIKGLMRLHRKLRSRKEDSRCLATGGL